ncbi:MAG: bifunctional folylpolyglutamate synthase/dihydrofolate synthase [Tannerella sp.]|jgi:dihydrofolate synthase/folylpolyglutamate synthase|nr:bifunctional folylpolyglutamate synthase/dihydrofolate synthase [Tannerella sp.]
MSYEETIEYLYRLTPAFHRIGADAYKPGLERSMKFDELCNTPHKRYKSIHIAGTNGKGSVAHLLAAVLQSCGYKVGLYTSPHLLDFRERIRVNGHPITSQYVIDFVNKFARFIEHSQPSFFEVTTALALDYFRHKKVAYAVIETGLGGRLDSTNIIAPIMSIITSISLEHTDLLGDTVSKIANEKAGIIKRGVPVIIGEMSDLNLTEQFRAKAFEVSAPIIFSTSKDNLLDAEIKRDSSWVFETADFGNLTCDLRGLSQKFNVQTVLTAIQVLLKSGLQLRLASVRKAFTNVSRLTGLMGRWQEINSKPKIVCDIAHNPGAWNVNMRQLFFEASHHEKIHIVLGFSKDKDVDRILYTLPKNAVYYFTQAETERAMPATELAEKGSEYHLKGQAFDSVIDAVNDATMSATDNDFILISGSAFVVAEALKLFPNAIL